ncbi:hypothetical protein ACLOJK_033337 [Asimina triloba]
MSPDTNAFPSSGMPDATTAPPDAHTQAAQVNQHIKHLACLQDLLSSRIPGSQIPNKRSNFSASYPKIPPSLMDWPSATEAQSQHRQKRIQHDKQQQVSACQPYDLSQVQDYEACHLYAQPYALHQQYYPYHPYFAYDYGNAIAAVNAYQEVSQVGEQLQQEVQTSYEFPPGLEPSAAVAAAAAAMSALSQVSQFAGKMDAVEQALMEMPEQLWSNEACIQMDSFQHSKANNINLGYIVMTLMEDCGYIHKVKLIVLIIYPFFDTDSIVPRTVLELFHRSANFPAEVEEEMSHLWATEVGSIGTVDGLILEHLIVEEEMALRNASDVILISYEPAPYQEQQSEDALTTESTAAEATGSAMAPTTSQGWQRRTLQTARCDLCKVDCNTWEILQQHKNGKRHKKNMQKLEEFKECENILSESQQASGQPGSVLGVEKSNQSSVEDLPKTTVTKDENETEERTMLTEEQAEVPTAGLTKATTGRLRMDGSLEYQGHPSKQKVQGNLGPRDWKRLKQSESVSCSGAPKVQPKYCALCHVTCDTQVVFESHLAGKKHTSRVKKAKSSRGKYMAVGLHALYMPDALQTGLEARAQQESQIEGQKKKSIVKVVGQQAVWVSPAGQDATIEDAVHKSDG